jgi:hypothetical protein
MECVRADEERVGGIIHRPMFERLLVCDFAVADLTTANANVFYELGVRHALRPHTTLLTTAKGSGVPFDLGPVRVQCRYALDDDGKPARPGEDSTTLKEALAARRGTHDSPVYAFLDLREPTWDRKALSDAFRRWRDDAAKLHRRLCTAQHGGPEALAAFQLELGDPWHLDATAPRPAAATAVKAGNR